MKNGEDIFGRSFQAKIRKKNLYQWLQFCFQFYLIYSFVLDLP